MEEEIENYMFLGNYSHILIRQATITPQKPVLWRRLISEETCFSKHLNNSSEMLGPRWASTMGLKVPRTKLVLALPQETGSLIHSLCFSSECSIILWYSIFCISKPPHLFIATSTSSVLLMYAGILNPSLVSSSIKPFHWFFLRKKKLEEKEKGSESISRCQCDQVQFIYCKIRIVVR